MKHWRTQPRQPLVGLAVAAMAGIAAAEHGSAGVAFALALSAAGVAFLLWRPGRFMCWIFCALAFFELHTLRRENSDAVWLSQILREKPSVVEASGVVWSEPEPPATWSGRITGHFDLKLDSASISGQRFISRAMMKVSWMGPLPAYGDRISIRAAGMNLPPTRNPGEFDARAYQQRRGVYSELFARYAGDCQITAHGQGNPIMAAALQLRHRMENGLVAGLEKPPPEITAVIEGVVLGLRGETPEDLRMLLQRTGTIHLFVVSGLNIAMLMAIVLFTLRLAGVPRGPRLALTILVLIAYALITGLRVSTVRATFMASLFLIAGICDRRPFSLNNLAAAALLLLLYDSNELFATGFQFSFAIVFVIIALGGRIQRACEKIGRPDPFLPRILWSWTTQLRASCWRGLSGAIAVSVASWVGALLFTAGYFHLFSPGSLVGNLMAVPVAFIILSLGVGSLTVGILSRAAAALVNNVNWFAAKLMVLVLQVAANVPGGYVYVEIPSAAPQPRCEICALDLGDGAAIHIRADGQDWLIDCGDPAHYQRTVLPYLRSRGVNRLSGLLVTHGSVKHLGAAATAVMDFRPHLIADSTFVDRSATRKAMHSALENQAKGKGLYARGDYIHVGSGATIRVLYPPLGAKLTVAADKALVLQLESCGVRVLLMSDSGFPTEEWLLENEPDLRSEVLIKGQHPKELSGTPDFLARVAPQVAVCGALGYGRPLDALQQWENEARASGVAVFRQDQTGAVRIEIDENGFTVSGYVGEKKYRGRPANRQIKQSAVALGKSADPGR